jgi:hypothetical protein
MEGIDSRDAFENDLVVKGSRKNNFTFLSADASCLAALRKLDLSRYAGAFAPCQAGASTLNNVKSFLREPLEQLGKLMDERM